MTKRKRYRVLTGINYPPNDKRAEPGDVVDDIPPASIGWLLKDGVIEEFVAGQNTPAELAAAKAGEPTEEAQAAEAGADAAAAIDALDDEPGAAEPDEKGGG